MKEKVDNWETSESVTGSSEPPDKIKKVFKSNTKYQTSKGANPHLGIGWTDFKNQIWGSAYKINSLSDLKV